MKKTAASAPGASNRPPGRKDGKGQPLGPMTVAELEEASGVPSQVIRYYTRLGLLKPNRNPENGYKLFNQHHIGRLQFIRRAKLLGYSLKEIMEICRNADRGESPCPCVREIIERRITENREKLDSMAKLQMRMEAAVRKWRRLPDGTPDGDTVCHLIESFDD